MRNPNDNLHRLTQALVAFCKNRSALAALKALVATDMFLLLFLFGQDYFGWWRSPWPIAVDGSLVLTMISFSGTLCAFFAMLAMLYLLGRARAARSGSINFAKHPLSRVVRAVYMPFSYAFPCLWGIAYLEGGNARFWGSICVVLTIFYAVGNFVLIAAERSVELRRQRAGRAASGNSIVAGGIVGQEQPAKRPARPGLRFLLWQRWWLLTHPGYIRRMPPLNRSLYVAVARGDSRSVAAYLSRGADPNTRIALDNPLLNFAVSRNNAEVVRLLLEFGARADTASPSNGASPLIAAAVYGNLTSARLLLDHGARTSTRTHNGTTALSMAVRKNNAEFVKLLLSHHAPVNVCDKSGVTPLMLATSQGQEQILRTLLEAGANPAVKDAKGVTALEYARRKGHVAIVTLLGMTSG